ncbi:hypothetical protein [Inhella gelatinilytica]|uniref:Uncharacterized protein n=1 Tax=Inhella gelatinilytica TaxID=2795030 RepID=A0A931IZK9_9BURK|nr:hypothetical protein [Inhella gelatinilytica]MBH9553920.1 hypothetical protein [Inhella gelatinilytica]
MAHTALRWLSALGLSAAVASPSAAPRLTPAQHQALEVLLGLPQQPDGARSLWTLALTADDEWVVSLGLRTCQGDTHCERVLALRWIQVAPGNFRAWIAAQPHLPMEQSLRGLVGSHYANDFRSQHCAAYQARPPAANGTVPAWPQRFVRAQFANTFRAPMACRAPAPEASDTRSLCEGAAEAVWRWSQSEAEQQEALWIIFHGGPRRTDPRDRSAEWMNRRADLEARRRDSKASPKPWRAEDSPCPHPAQAR